MQIRIASRLFTVCRTKAPIVREGVRRAGEFDWAAGRILVDGELTAGAAWEAFIHEILEAFETLLPPDPDREKRVDWTTTIKAMTAESLAGVTVDQLLALPADADPSPSPPVTSDVRLKTSKFKHLSPDQFEVAKHLWTKYGLDPWDDGFHVQVIPDRDGLQVRLCLHLSTVEAMARASDAWAGMDAPDFDYDGGGEIPTRCRVTVYRLVDGVPRAFVGEVHWNECFGSDVEQLPEVVRLKPLTCLEARAVIKVLRRAFGVPFYLKEEFDSPRGSRPRRAPVTPAEQDEGPHSADGMHVILAERFGLDPISRKKLVARTALTFGDRTDGDEVRFYRAVIAAAEAVAKKAG